MLTNEKLDFVVVIGSENQGRPGWDVVAKESNMGGGRSELHFGNGGDFG